MMLVFFLTSSSWGGSTGTGVGPCSSQARHPPCLQWSVQPPKCPQDRAGAAGQAGGSRGLRDSRAEANREEKTPGPRAQLHVSSPWERSWAPWAWWQQLHLPCLGVYSGRGGRSRASHPTGSMTLRLGPGLHGFSRMPGGMCPRRLSTQGGKDLSSVQGPSVTTHKHVTPAPMCGPQPLQTWSARGEVLKILCPGPAWRPWARHGGGCIASTQQATSLSLGHQPWVLSPKCGQKSKQAGWGWGLPLGQAW